MKHLALKAQLRALGAPGLFAALALVLAAGLAWQGQRWEREAAADAARGDRLRGEARPVGALAPDPEEEVAGPDVVGRQGDAVERLVRLGGRGDVEVRGEIAEGRREGLDGTRIQARGGVLRSGGHDRAILPAPPARPGCVTPHA